MELGYTIVYVSNVLHTVAFYEKAFSLKIKFVHESNQYAEMQTGKTTLAFASEAFAEGNGLSFKPNRAHDFAPAFELAFVTDDVTSALETALAAGAQQLMPPTEKPWGQTVAYVADINGVIVEICSPMQS